METNRKRRGFVKTKLMPFYKAMKPSSDVVQYDSSTTTTTTNKVLNSAYVRQHDYNYVIATAQPPKPHQKVSFVVPAAAAATVVENNNLISSEKKLNLLAEKLFGAAVNVDESVDVRAATYISSVREKFKLESHQQGLSVKE